MVLRRPQPQLNDPSRLLSLQLYLSDFQSQFTFLLTRRYHHHQLTRRPGRSQLSHQHTALYNEMRRNLRQQPQVWLVKIMLRMYVSIRSLSRHFKASRVHRFEPCSTQDQSLKYVENSASFSVDSARFSDLISFGILEQLRTQSTKILPIIRHC